MYIIYSLPFAIGFIILLTIFKDSLEAIGDIASGLIGIGLGIIAIIIGVFIYSVKG